MTKITQIPKGLRKRNREDQVLNKVSEWWFFWNSKTGFYKAMPLLKTINAHTLEVIVTVIQASLGVIIVLWISIIDFIII